MQHTAPTRDTRDPLVALNAISDRLDDLARDATNPTAYASLLRALDTVRADLRAAAVSTPALTVVITPNEKGNPPGKLADAELHFLSGPLEGAKLIGFGIWERRTGGGRNVTFPARQYSVNGERRSFALLRPISETGVQNRIRDLILDAYDQSDSGNVAGPLGFQYDDAGARIAVSTILGNPDATTADEPISIPADHVAAGQVIADAITTQAPAGKARRF